MKEVHKLARLDVRLVVSVDSSMLVQNGSESLLIVSVKTEQDLDPSLVKLKRLVDEKKIEVFSKGGDGVLRYRNKLYVKELVGLFGCVTINLLTMVSPYLDFMSCVSLLSYSHASSCFSFLMIFYMKCIILKIYFQAHVVLLVCLTS